MKNDMEQEWRSKLLFKNRSKKKLNYSIKNLLQWDPIKERILTL